MSRGAAAQIPLQWRVPQWPAPANVRAIYTQRGGGVSLAPFDSLNLGDHVDDDPAAVADNRRSLQAAARLPAEPVWLTQVHGVRVRDLDSHGDGPADAATTAAPGRICTILTADCLPVLFAAQSGLRIGAAHAGWRGLAAGVIEATVEALQTPPSELLAWLGPAIGARHFEVGAEVREELLRPDPGAAAAFAPSPAGRFMADLYALARRRLVRLGIDRIFGGEGCTYTEADKYFSHRRDGRTGRQATLIWLE